MSYQVLMTMRQSNRSWSLWYLLGFVGIGLIIVKLTQSNLPYVSITEEVSEKDEKIDGRKYVMVPISQILSGKPIVLPQDDKRIIDYIWSNHHVQSPSTSSYNLEDPENDPSRGQGQFIRNILKNMTNGFFVECGALDGETRSNTLFMEMHLGWKGLLIEGDPSNFALMKKKNRKAWTANTCLAVKPYPHTANFRQSFNVGKIVNSDEPSSSQQDFNVVNVQCMPLFSLLTALNVTTVDYFSLDVEGNELQVLKTIPFNKVNIRTLSVEYIHTTEGKEETIKFMKSQGYKMVGEVHFPNNLANDLMFVLENIDTQK